MKFRTGSYANVASTLALVVALGGTSYAAIAIPRNSVASPQIVNNSVKSVDVKNGNLKAVDFRAGELPAGAQGPTGATGLQGPIGPVGPSHGYGVDSGTDPLTWTGAVQTVSTIAVPAGSYVVFAKVLGNNNDAGESDINCELRANGSVLDAGYDVLELAANGVAGDRQYMPLTGTLTAAAPTTLTITCEAESASGNWLSRAITAVKVGAIG